MKTTFKSSGYAFILLLALTFIACQKETSSVQRSSTSNNSGNATAANASNEKHTVIEFPGSFTTYLDCLGEEVSVSGNVRLTFITVVNDNHYNMKIITHISSGSAVGLTSGTEFFVRGENSTTMQGSFVNGQARNTYVNTFSYIGKGQLPNIYFHQVTNFVVNADGTVTASVDNQRVDCAQ